MVSKVPSIRHQLWEIRTARLNLQTGLFLALVAVVAAPRVVADVVVEVVVERNAMAEVAVESEVVVEQPEVVLDSRCDQAVKVTEPEVVAREWPDATVVSAHMRPGTTLSGTVAVGIVAFDSVVSGFGPERSRRFRSGRS